MSGKAGSCPYAYWIKDTIHCRRMDEKAAKWTFCKHQHYCRLTRRHELAEDADKCNLTEKKREV